MIEHLVETWQIHNRIHLYLLETITDEALEASLTAKSRNVYSLFAHIHNVRLMWLKSASPVMLETVEKLETKPTGTLSQLKQSFMASGSAMESMITHSVESDGRIKGFKPHVTAFVAYLISHESHHRGQIEWALRAGGHPLSDKASYGLWEWGVR